MVQKKLVEKNAIAFVVTALDEVACKSVCLNLCVCLCMCLIIL